MNWISLSIISALALSLRHLAFKESANRFNEYFSIALMSLVASILSVFLFLKFDFIVKDEIFWKYFLIRVSVDYFCFITFFKALKLKSVSFVVPLLSVMPIMSALSAYLIREEAVGFFGGIGIFIVSMGAFLVAASELKFVNNKFIIDRDFLTALGLMIVTVVGWGFLNPIHKEAIEVSNPYTYFFLGNISLFLLFAFSLLASKPNEIKQIFSKSTGVVYLAGLLWALDFLTQLLAVEKTFVGYVSAIKTLNIVFSPLLAVFLFGDKISLVKFLGIMIIISGSIMIAVS